MSVYLFRIENKKSASLQHAFDDFIGYSTISEGESNVELKCLRVELKAVSVLLWRLKKMEKCYSLSLQILIL